MYDKRAIEIWESGRRILSLTASEAELLWPVLAVMAAQPNVYSLSAGKRITVQRGEERAS